MDRRGSWSAARGGPPGRALCPRHCRQRLIGSPGPWPSFFKSSCGVVVALRWRVGDGAAVFGLLRSVRRQDFGQNGKMAKLAKWHIYESYLACASSSIPTTTITRLHTLDLPKHPMKASIAALLPGHCGSPKITRAKDPNFVIEEFVARLRSLSTRVSLYTDLRG